jgi:hypothetical protein
MVIWLTAAYAVAFALVVHHGHMRVAEKLIGAGLNVVAAEVVSMGIVLVVFFPLMQSIATAIHDIKDEKHGDDP